MMRSILEFAMGFRRPGPETAKVPPRRSAAISTLGAEPACHITFATGSNIQPGICCHRSLADPDKLHRQNTVPPLAKVS